MSGSHEFSDLLPSDAPAIQALITAAMDADEGVLAAETIRRHFAAAGAGISDGRRYYVYREGGSVAGMVGLHHYEWGPAENVWLGWFAVHPSRQGNGIGKSLLALAEKKALETGYKKFFVETYGSPTFARAREFYARQGFVVAGQVANYLPDGGDMVVFCKWLNR